VLGGCGVPECGASYQQFEMARSASWGGLGHEQGSQRLKETCHDIRQPVAGVLALAGAALADPGLPEVARSHLEQIVTQAKSLADVIQHRLMAGEPAKAAEVRLTDLAMLADEVAAAERLTYEGELEVVPSPEPVLVWVNQLDVRSIISNLLSNATRAAGPVGSVKVEISHDSCRAQLTVEDTGPGFGKAAGGAGLGWRIMTQSLARCGGKISYGQGTHGGVRASLWLSLATV
jgi:two-component system, OmpR family, sensor kinase